MGTTTPAATDPRLYSFLCMSCHEGVTSPTVIGPTNVHAVGNVAHSFGLTNDHPVNMTHDPVADTGLKTVAQVTSLGSFYTVRRTPYSAQAATTSMKARTADFCALPARCPDLDSGESLFRTDFGLSKTPSAWGRRQAPQEGNCNGWGDKTSPLYPNCTQRQKRREHF